jgi:hypothetical protein
MKLTKAKLKQLIKEELQAVLTEDVDDLHEEAADISSFWRKASTQLNNMCKDPEFARQQGVDCSVIGNFLKILQKHPVTRALASGKMARPRHYKKFISTFKPPRESLDPEVLMPLIIRVAS